MDEDFGDKDSLVARIRQLERERNDLQKDIEQLCMQQAGPSYLGVASRMHFQRTAMLEKEIEDLKKKFANCSRENQNLQEELSEVYRIKSQLADLHSAEVLKNAEAEKQLRFFQGCVAAAFAERDNAIMEAEKVKEKVELIPQELIKCQKRVEKIQDELLVEKNLAETLRADTGMLERQNKIFREVVDKFYHIRQCSLDYFSDVTLDEKCECLLNDSPEMWRFQDDQDTSSADYINSLEAEIETMKNTIDNLQKRLHVGLEIETHLKKKVRDLEKMNIVTMQEIKKHISSLHRQHSEHRTVIKDLFDQWFLELASTNELIAEKISEVGSAREINMQSLPIQEKELHETECKEVHVSADSGLNLSTKIDESSLPDSISSETSNLSKALALALEEKVQALLLLSQQEERHLLERDVNAALQEKVQELRRNLLQVTNEKVRALMELAQLKQEKAASHEKIGEQKSTQEKEGKIRNLLKGAHIATRWIVGSDRDEDGTHLPYEKSNRGVDYARMKIESATLKESVDSMEHLVSSVHRLRLSLEKIRDSGGENTDSRFISLDQIITEAKLIKTALSSSWPRGNERMDHFVSAAGLEMVELLIDAAQLLSQDNHSSSSASHGRATA